ncbi:MAG TPA: imidazole glycerol phosphate synthase subunit HisH [Candidatus Gallimonas intestinigallinarum]|uniref:Imidazole glycerol phosphate synthase subunit HisH n=1 Tax=Candidatus Gallimonas intestinigallinarum TaxID=2838604 RepID=A0A9D2IV18_9FIRM|nr:imidazole glycerol phosphate synthase subunit HisH [Candidatus Gallimonas intestinigallinarum]
MIGIIDYGMGNLRSVQKAIEYLGGRACISSDRSELDGCEKLILPGVGSFAAGMKNLNDTGLAPYIVRRTQDTPLLGICLGMQFLLQESEEDGVNAGLGLIGGRVVRFTEGKIPHIGWNSVEEMRSPLFAGIPSGTEFYFVHSYYADTTDEFTIGKTEYYRVYASAVGKGSVYGVQFHPEKSGAAGLQLLRNYMQL